MAVLELNYLIHHCPVFAFYTLWKHQKTYGRYKKDTLGSTNELFLL